MISRHFRPLLLLCLFVSASAWAETEEEAKKRAGALIDDGNRQMGAEHPERALRSYEQAYEAYPSPKILINLAEAERALGHTTQALALYRRFLAEGAPEPGSRLERGVRERIDELQKELGFLRLLGAREGTAIRVDGRPAGTAPLEPIPLAPGLHRIETELPGYEPQRTETKVVSGQTVEVELHSVPSTPAIEAAPAPAVVAPVMAEDDAITGRWWFWSAIAVGAAAVATVVVVASTSGGGFLPEGELGATRTSDWRRF